ncbi:MAG: hypothetical protein MJE63_06890 [Proteobacteria bacterium]|nr:hypothetical protein [Pseudomonadota bacterium]
MNNKNSTGIKKILGMLTVMLLVAVTASAISWYQNMNARMGTISVVELADWMIRGNVDYKTVYVAPKVTKIEKINGLICITEDGALKQELEKLPVYKKWVIITPEGNLSEETSKLLAQSKAHTVLVLEGGRQAWESQVVAPSVAGLSLSSEEITQLNNVRPFFHENAAEAAVAAPVVRPVAAANAQPAVADDEPEEEEGC